MKKLLISAVALFFTTSAHAAPINGFSDVVNNGGGSWTFIFDTVASDIDGNSDGLKFTNGAGLDITATATGLNNAGATVDRTVRQDHPAHGGLGVLGAPNGDNLGVGEKLTLMFSRAVNILGFTLNDGHQPAATGNFNMASGGGSVGGTASVFDGVGIDSNSNGQLCAFSFTFCASTSMTLSSSSFTGYLESVTIQYDDGTGGTIPLPAGLPLLLSALGMGGLLRLRQQRAA